VLSNRKPKDTWMGGVVARQIAGHGQKQGFKSNQPYSTAAKRAKQTHNLPNGRRQIM